MRTLVQHLASFIHRITFSDLPPDVVESSRLILLDSIGCALAGCRQPSVMKLAEVLSSDDARPEGKFTVFGTERKTDLLTAVLLNASSADSLEYSDVNKLVGGHPSCMVVPVALNLAEEYPISGKDLLLAIVAGYEAHRLMIPLYPSAFRNGLHLVMPGGALGACATACKVMRLNEQQIADALGVCGAVVPVAPFEPCRAGGYVKDLYTGWSAYTGVFSALLAKAGFTGTATIFEGELGLYRVLRAEKEVSSALEGLGGDWVIRRSCIKLHASCRFTHACCDAALSIAKRRDIRPAEVKRIEVITHTISYQLNRGFPPRDAIDARFSIPYVVAVVLLRKRLVEINDFAPERLCDHDVHEIATKVEVSLDRTLDRDYPEPPEGKGLRTAIVKVEFEDGSCLSERIDLPKGDPGNPASPEEVVEKFKFQASSILPLEKTNKILKVVEDIENVDNVQVLVSLLRPG